MYVNVFPIWFYLYWTTLFRSTLYLYFIYCLWYIRFFNINVEFILELYYFGCSWKNQGKRFWNSLMFYGNMWISFPNYLRFNFWYVIKRYWKILSLFLDSRIFIIFNLYRAHLYYFTFFQKWEIWKKIIKTINWKRIITLIQSIK